MSATLVTQCPHCQTRFRLSQEHLRAAAGNVRCGACLKVFNANPPTGKDSSTTETAGALPERQSRSKARLDDVLIHDDLELDDLDLEDLGLDESIIDEVNPAPPPQKNSQPLNSPPASRMSVESRQEPEAYSETEPRPEPESESESESETPQSTASVPRPASEPEPEINYEPTADLEPEPAVAIDTDPVTEWFKHDDADIFTVPDGNSERESLASDIFLRDQPEAARAPAPPLPLRYDDDLPAHEESEQDFSGLHAKRDDSEPVTETPVEKRREPLLGDDFMLPELDSEALFLDDQPLTRPHQRSALWGLLSLLAVLTLVGQFGYFNFAALAHDERSRPLITSWCSLVGCQLPPQVDISLIRSSNLTVRAHPEYPNTLAIDVILYNRADFAQPFPVLRMRFTDQSDREVASRLFRPQEYLGGELAGARLMPAQTPIHVGLSMLAPDQAGSSYRLDFLSPEQ